MNIRAARDPARLRVLYLITDPVSLRFLKGQLQFLQNDGFEVEVASSFGNRRPHWIAQVEETRLHEIPYTRSPSILRDLSALAITIWVIVRRNPHILNASTPKAGVLGMIAARLANVPVRVYVVRGLRYETAVGWKRLLLKAVEILAISCSSHVIFNSESLKTLCEEERLVRSSKGFLLGSGSGNGIDMTDFDKPAHQSNIREQLGIDDEATVIGFVGRLAVDKGFLDLLEVFELVRDRFPNAVLLLVGDYETDILSSVRTKVSKDSAIIHIGWLDDVSAIYPAIDAIVFPSYREGLPNVPLEAQAAGVPIVAYRATGTINAINPRYNVLVPRGDIEALAEALVESLTAPRAGARLAAREWVRTTFNQTTIWTELAGRYKSWSG